MGLGAVISCTQPSSYPDSPNIASQGFIHNPCKKDEQERKPLHPGAGSEGRVFYHGSQLLNHVVTLTSRHSTTTNY
jgi:hypothetical protein